MENLEGLTIVELLGKLKDVIVPLCKKVEDIELDIYKVRNDARFLSNKNLELIKINEGIVKDNERLRIEGQIIIDNARKEADSIIAIANENLIVSQKEITLAKADREKAKNELDLALRKAEEIAKV